MKEEFSIKSVLADKTTLEACVKILNEEWPRSDYARRLMLERCDSKAQHGVAFSIEGGSETFRCVGFGKLTPFHWNQENAFVESVVISKELRGKGFGKTLMRLLEQYAQSVGVSALYLTTHDVCKFYEKCGYEYCDPVVFSSFTGSNLSADFLRKLSGNVASAPSSNRSAPLEVSSDNRFDGELAMSLYELPIEVTVGAPAFVALCGLNITENPAHKQIYDFFSEHRAERVNIKYQIVDPTRCFFPAKQKRTAYDYYIPKGILKSSWIRKHSECIPAVVVYFVELDWEDTQWNEKQNSCAVQVTQIRESLAGRNTRVCVVMLQRNMPLPPGEDVMARERAASLCRICQLPVKQLFVLPQSDHVSDYVVRCVSFLEFDFRSLENAFFESAQSYYYGEAKLVKSHRELLNRTTHQYLFVRHAFKIGFFNELKQDPIPAIKAYRGAFESLVQLRHHPTHAREVNTIAAIVSYKVCRLCFENNQPLEAIAHFRQHINNMRQRPLPPALAHEHAALLAKQCEIFGELFATATRAGLTALCTQHPGTFDAAEWRVKRLRRLFEVSK